jgi:NADH-quinone oxidoreductase subunit G
VRGDAGIREATLKVGGKEFSLAVVSGLGNARKLIERIKSGESEYDLIEIMACPGGCIGGAGQPVSNNPAVKKQRTKGIYENDRMLLVHKSQDNPYVNELYRNFLGEIGGHKAHELLHTAYRNRKRIVDEDVPLSGANGGGSVDVNICVGTSCFLKGSQRLLHEILNYLRMNSLEHLVNVSASFCFEQCDRGPTVRIGDQVIEHCTLDQAIQTIGEQMGPSQEEGAYHG